VLTQGNVFTDLFPSNGRCTVACLHSCYLATGAFEDKRKLPSISCSSFHKRRTCREILGSVQCSFFCRVVDWAAALAYVISDRQNCGAHGIWKTNTFWLASQNSVGFCVMRRGEMIEQWGCGGVAPPARWAHNKSHFALIIIPCHKSATDRRSRSVGAVN
jgi:hypothetical protein